MSEGLHDTSWQNDEGDKITLVDLLDATEDIPVKNVLVNKLKSKLLTWNGDDNEIAKIEKADLEYPILIFVDDDGKFISIIDGHHRAQKAVKHKLKTIKAKLIPINSLPKDIKKVFNHLKIQEQKERETTNRKNLDFFDLVNKGIVFVTEPFGDGKKQKPNWEGDSNIITLWNLKHPEQGQEWVFDAVKYPKPEAIQWWNDEGQFTLKNKKYYQILRSIKLFNNSNKQQQNESKITKSSNEKLEKLIGNYITMSYPTAQKIRLAPPGVNGSITTFTLPDPQDERDNLIFKFDVFGKPEYNINPEFLNSIKSLFGEKKNMKKLILKWFEEKEVDEDLIDNPINESLEDIQGMPLYHHTTESRALSIMNTNMLRGTRPDDDILAVDPTLDNTSHQSMVSFTRDKNFVANGTIGASAGGLGDSKKLSVIFVVDKDKLKSHYKIVPFDYSALEDRWYDKRMKDEPDTIMQPKTIRTSKSNEYEERVLTNKIQPLRRYVTDIIYKGNNPLVQEKIDEFLGRKKQEQNESELTERCWKGYTQKGMKTMFGKRYPNCVKKK